MPDPDKLNPLTLDLLSAATVIDLHDGADQLAALVREVRKPLPILTSTDLTEREAMLALLLWHKTEAAKRLLALLAG